MRIGVTSDLHGMLPEVVEPCELVLLCGDITPLRMQRSIPQSERWLQTEFADWINKFPCKQVYMVGGNHDFALANMYANPSKKYNILTKPTNGKVIMLDNEEAMWFGSDGIYTLWGTPYCKIFGNWAYMYGPETLKRAYEGMSEKCHLVLSHDAPQLCGLGTINKGIYSGTDAGNYWLADEILRKHPKYVFCGHIHSGEHTMQTLDDINLVNVSYVNESYVPTYPILYLDVQN